MTEREFQTKLAELLGEITTLPAVERAKLEAQATDTQTETRKTHERLTQSVNSLQESVDYLRLSIKYVLFDLEATRRENATLRSLLRSTDPTTDDLA